jgi:hypothetical protein
MKFNGLSMVFLLAAIGLGGWAVFEQGQRRKVEARLATVTQERDAYQKTATKKLALSAKTDVKAEGPEGLGPDHAEALAEEQRGKEKGKPKETPEVLGGMGDAMQEMMKDPKMMEAIKSQARSQVDLMYRDLFDLLGLDEAKQAQLSKLLAERTSAGMELGMAMMGGAKTDKDTLKKMGEDLKKAQTASDQALKDLLGDEAYNKFDRFEKSQPERQQLNTLNSQLKDKGLGLTAEAESQLMDAMYQERTNFKFEQDFADQSNFDPDTFNEAAVQRYNEQQSELQAKVLQRAQGILNAEQLEIFRQSQEQAAAMQKMGMEMGLRMMKGK